MMKYLKSYFSLKYVEFCFTDVVSGKPVCLYKDSNGELWMKNSKWGLFRCKYGPQVTE